MGLNHHKTIKREHNKEKELPVNQREHSEEHTESLRTALKEANLDEILECVKKGADVNVTADGMTRLCMNCECQCSTLGLGCEYATALQLASFLRDTYSVTMLLDCGADPNIKGENAIQFRRDPSRYQSQAVRTGWPCGRRCVAEVGTLCGYF
jgi:hypothetical protein